MLPVGSIFFPLIQPLLRHGFLYIETLYHSKVVFDDTDINILKECVNLLLIV